MTATPFDLPQPYATPSAVNFATVIGWPEGKRPQAPQGFEVQLYAKGLDYPRWLFELPNGDVLVAQSRTLPRPGQDESSPAVEGQRRSRSLGVSANRITLFRSPDAQGIPQERHTFLEGLSQPLGMALRGADFYVGNTDGVVVFPYEAGATRITGQGRKILELPAGGYNNHWTRNVVLAPDGDKLFVTVGSASIPMAATSSSMPAACATRSASISSRRPVWCGLPSTNATNSATSSSPTT